MGLVLLIIILLLALGGLPLWPHAAAWGWYPSSGLGIIVLILLILLVIGRI